MTLAFFFFRLVCEQGRKRMTVRDIGAGIGIANFAGGNETRNGGGEMECELLYLFLSVLAISSYSKEAAI